MYNHQKNPYLKDFKVLFCVWGCVCVTVYVGAHVWISALDIIFNHSPPSVEANPH